MTEPQLIEAISDSFEKIVQEHQKKLLKEHSKLKNYQLNPIIIKYLSQLKENKISADGIAKALLYPRALGTSITGSFGAKFQKMLVELKVVKGSLIKGIDIEFIDKIDGKTKYCQLKAGPNTINSGDVAPILSKFDKVVNLARTNNYKDFSNNDLIVGVLYGNTSQLSAHYLKIDKRYPVIVGADFWYHITGFPDIYKKFIAAIEEYVAKMPASTVFQEALQKLTSEIKTSNIV